MSRVWADRIVRALIALIAAGVLWIIAYEVAVGIRHRAVQRSLLRVPETTGSNGLRRHEEGRIPRTVKV
jgi:hypothetical protein